MQILVSSYSGRSSETFAADEGLCASLGSKSSTRTIPPAFSRNTIFVAAPKNLNFRAFDAKIFSEPHSPAVAGHKYASAGHAVLLGYIYICERHLRALARAESRGDTMGSVKFGELF
jgi:hypothetical protein